MSRLESILRTKLALRLLFDEPTVRGLAERVERAWLAGRGFEVPKIRKTERESVVPLSYAQQRLWFLDQLSPGSPLYNSCAMFRLTGDVDEEALEWSVGEVVRRHEALRTIFPRQGEAPVQVICSGMPVPLHIVNLEPPAQTDLERAIDRIVADAVEQPFDLAAGPLVQPP